MTDESAFIGLSDAEVFARWRAAMEELKRRGLVRSTNANPVGGYAEMLVATHFGTEPLTGRDEGFDLVRPDTRKRVQVKGRRFRPGKPATHFGEFDLFSDRRFDEFVGVVFNEDFTVKAAWLMPWETVDRLAKEVRGKRRLYIRHIATAVAREDATIEALPL